MALTLEENWRAPGLDAAPEALDAVVRRCSPLHLKLYVVAADVVAISIAMLGAYAVSRIFHPFDSRGAQTISLWIAVVSLPLWIATFAEHGLYKARRVSARLDEVGALVHATVVSTLMTAALSFLLKQPVARGWLILCLPISFALCLIEREVVRAIFGRLRNSGRLLRPVVVVGANAEAETLCDMLCMPGVGYEIVGVVDDGDSDYLAHIPILGRVSDTLDVVRATGASGVMVVTTAISAAASNALVRDLTEVGVHVEMSSSLRGIFAGRLRVRAVGTTPVIYVEPVRRGGWRALAKRCFDVVGAGIGLLLSLPLLAIVVVAIKLESRGPVFFSQIRVGKDSEPFRILKFRSMVANAEAMGPGLVELNEADGPLFKIKEDPRTTRVGRVIRRLSIDELPQLVNVLRGEMSLVGPRPALYAEMHAWIPELRDRLRVRPGLTGMWQVSGRSDLGFADYIRYDLYYVENWTLWSDLAIMAKTVPVLFRNRGAY